MAIHIGWARRRWSGLVVAGVTFVLRAMLITGALDWAYVRFGKLPETAWLLWGVKPVILAVVLQALWNLAPLGLEQEGSGAVERGAIRASAYSAVARPSSHSHRTTKPGSATLRLQRIRF
jgi:chromate transporter